MAHSVESHPQKQEIIDSLLSGKTLKQIAVTLSPPLSVMALCRYRKAIIRPTLQKAVAVTTINRRLVANTKTMQAHGLADIPDELATSAVRETSELLRNAPLVEPYLSRIRKHQETIDEAVDFACQNEDPRTVAALLATDYKGMEFHARLCGVSLDGAQAPAGANINLAVMVSVPRATVDDPAPSVDVTYVDVPHS